MINNFQYYVDDFHRILELQNPPVEYELWSDGISLKMKNHRWPMSLMEPEFNFIRDLVERYDLKNGYEVATGFGVSAIAAGIGFKKTGGKLITLDSYVEEKSENFYIYRNSEPKKYYDTDGYKSVKFLIKNFELDNVVFPKVGWSPDDVESVVKNYTNKKFDYVFIDGGHFPEQIIKDVNAILPFIDDNFVIVFHDTFSDYFTEEVMTFLEKTFGKLPEVRVPAPNGCNTSVIIKK